MHPNYEGGYKNPYEDQAFLKSQVGQKVFSDVDDTQAIKLTIAVESEDESLTGETDESYMIDIKKSPGKKVNCEKSKCVINACPLD